MSTRVFIGNLSYRTDERELDYRFGKYGRIRQIDIKRGFAFVEFDDPRDADDAVYYLDGTDIDGSRVQVEPAKSRGPRGGGRGGRGGREYKVVVENLSSAVSWQDLKDHMRRAGDVLHTDVWSDRDGTHGTATFSSSDDAYNAVRKLDDTELRGKYIRVYEEGRSRSRSPRRRSRSRSRDRRRSRSRSRSPRKSRSRSGSRGRSKSPVRSGSRSPRKSRSASPPPKESRSRSRSRSKSRDRDADPARDDDVAPSSPPAGGDGGDGGDGGEGEKEGEGEGEGEQAPASPAGSGADE